MKNTSEKSNKLKKKKIGRDIHTVSKGFTKCNNLPLDMLRLIVFWIPKPSLFHLFHSDFVEGKAHKITVVFFY